MINHPARLNSPASRWLSPHPGESTRARRF